MRQVLHRPAVDSLGSPLQGAVVDSRLAHQPAGDRQHQPRLARRSAATQLDEAQNSSDLTQVRPPQLLPTQEEM